jgi:type IV pilus assembly protein PilC
MNKIKRNLKSKAFNLLDSSMKALSNLKKRPETSKKDTKKKLKLKRPTSIRLSMKEKIFFVKRLSFLITAGVPILESLHMIEEQTSSKRFAKVMKNVVSDVTNGQFLSSSLAKFRKTFGELVINVIYVGETSGVLSENLEYLGEELRKKHA